jgi:hypothetical protein
MPVPVGEGPLITTCEPILPWLARPLESTATLDDRESFRLSVKTFVGAAAASDMASDRIITAAAPVTVVRWAVLMR